MRTLLTPKYTIKASGKATLSLSSRLFSSFSFFKVLFFYIIALLDTFFICILYGVSVLFIFLGMTPAPPSRKWESANFKFAMQRFQTPANNISSRFILILSIMVVS